MTDTPIHDELADEKGLPLGDPEPDFGPNHSCDDHDDDGEGGDDGA